MKWLKGHLRLVLAVVWALFALAIFVFQVTDCSWLLVAVAGGALLATNGMALRQRQRSQAWLWFYIIGLGLVPLLVALLAPSQQPVDDHVRSLGA